ncbi:response regulator [Halobacterium jilantaiense]|uniref:Response regulator receiver domain-containing protein n=1 Tax=Halobacterium jilantaiense TaxID=355548 RepID=A0A1I0N907_9EURY|nr:response regulator [Halobacterium jilantaiense]SEV97663.1 Response regulator receiver domain-containing protein [Halobacterium jilantaiense]
MTDEVAEVLVVDDDEALTDVYAAWLGDEYNVVTATTGTVALDTLDTDDVDVVLLDRRMPGLSGEDVLERIRNAEYECRVAMVTGVRPNTDVVELGFDEYLLKPVDREDLKATVETLLDRSKYDDKLQELYSLMSKRALLESEAEDGSVQLDDSYDNLVDRIENLREQINETVTDFGHDDFRVAFRDLPNGQTGSD